MNNIGDGPDTGGEPGDPDGEAPNFDCEFNPPISQLFITDTSVTSFSRDLSAEIAALGLPDNAGNIISVYSDIPTLLDNGGTLDENGVYTLEGLPGTELFMFVEIIFRESSESNDCLGTISFEVIISSGEFGADGPEIDPNDSDGPIDVPEQTAGLGEAPYPGDPGFCGVDTEIIELPEVITTTIENTVTTQITHPILDQPGVNIVNVFTNDSNIATVKDFFPQNNTLILELNGKPGGVAIVFEVRSATDTAPEDCAAVMYFILGVIDSEEIVCEVTQTFAPIFVEPGTLTSVVDLNPFFEAFGGFDAYSQSFKLDIVDPFLTVGQVFLDGAILSFEFNGIEGYDTLVFQNSDLNGNCINLLEVPVIIDASAAPNPDEGGGFGGPGPDMDSPGNNNDCPERIELGIGENAIPFEAGSGQISVDFSSALDQLNISNLADVEVEAYIYNAVGEPAGDWEIDSTNSFILQVPEGDYVYVIDIFFKDLTTGQCLGTIAFDVLGYSPEECITSFLNPEEIESGEEFYTGDTFTVQFNEFFFSPAGNNLQVQAISSNDLVTTNNLGNGSIEFTIGDQTGQGEITLIIIDPAADCTLGYLIPFIVEASVAPPDFNCPQYIEDIMPLFASNADPRQFTIDLNNYFFIPSSGINYTLKLPEEWGVDLNSDGEFIEPFVDIQLDESLLRINTDNRAGEIMFQIEYDSPNSSAGDDTCEYGVIDLMVQVDDELAFIEEQIQENCGDASDYLILGGTDFVPVELELGVQDEVKLDLRGFLLNTSANAEFYVRYDLLFPEPPNNGDAGPTADFDMDIPFIDGFIINSTELVIFAPRLEAGLGFIPINVFDFDTGCNYIFDVPVDVIDNIGVADIECPQSIMDFAEFTISQDEQLQLNLSDFFAVSGDASATAEFYYEAGVDQPEKVQFEFSYEDNSLVITPNSDPESFGEIFMFIKAGDSQEICEVFADVKVTILPAGLTENECPEATSAFTDIIEWPEPDDVLLIDLNWFFSDDQSILEYDVHAPNNPQFDLSENNGLLSLYLKEYVVGDVDITIDVLDPFGCIITKSTSIRFGESTPEFVFNRCPQLSDNGMSAVINSLADQGVIDYVMPSDKSLVQVSLDGLYFDLDGDNISYDGYSLNPSVATVDVQSNVLTIYFLPEKYGTVEFKFFARDGDPYCDPGQTLSISRNAPVNLEPEIICPEITSQVPSIEVVQGEPLRIINLKELFNFIAPPDYEVSAVSEDNSIVQPRIEGENLILEFSSDISGQAEVSILNMNIPSLTSETQFPCGEMINFMVTVVPPAVNLAPVFDAQSVTIQENDADETNAAFAKFASKIDVLDPEGNPIDLQLTNTFDDNGLLDTASRFEIREVPVSADISGTTMVDYELWVTGKLDFEDSEFYILVFEASDGEKTSTYTYKLNVEDIPNPSAKADFNLTVYNTDDSSTQSGTTSGTNGKNRAYKRFTNPRHRSQMEVGKWKVRKKITGGADKDLFEINQQEESSSGGPEQRDEVILVDVLNFKSPPDFENPQDHNKDNIYEVEVELINVDDGGSDVPIVVNQREIKVPENDEKTVEIQSIGATPAQDTDGDGVPDVTDNSPLYANPDQADADGDGVGDVTDDDDQDGVWNPGDGCADTALGERVDIYGCPIFYLPTNNFSITKSEKCVGTNTISIASLREDLTYQVNVSGSVTQTTSFTGSTYQIENLSAGTYTVCLTVDGVLSSVYERCYTMTIVEPQPLTVYSITDPSNNSVTFNLEGGSVYNITHNGMTTQTRESTYTISLKAGNNTIDINTGIGCQGEFGTTYFNSSPVDLAPNPFKSSLKLFIGGDDEAVSVSVFSMSGNQILRMDKVLEFGSRILEINTTSLNSGSYIIKINGATTQQSFVAIKQ